MMTRPVRTAVLALVLPLAGVMGDTAGAHDGPHGPDVLVDVQAATRQGTQVVLDLVLTNLGGPLVLTGMAADGAARVAITPVYLDFAQDVRLSQLLEFGKSPPVQFRVELQFGVAGTTVVTVAPNRGP